MPRGKTLSLPVLHIMLALADEPRHGYAIKQEVEQRTAGGVRLGPGTLYEAIQRLEESALIEEAPGGQPANGQEAQRRTYRLTALGWTTLAEEMRAHTQLVDAARANSRLRKSLT